MPSAGDGGLLLTEYRERTDQLGAGVLGLQGMALLFVSLGGVNFMLGAFNLLPSFPMDGGRVFRALMTPRVGRLKATEYAMKIGRVLAVVFILYGLYKGQWLLAAIGVFVYIAAGAEYRSVRLQERMGQGVFTHPWFTARPTPFGPPPSAAPRPRQAEPVDDGVYVSPPPCERKKPPPMPWKR